MLETNYKKQLKKLETIKKKADGIEAKIAELSYSSAREDAAWKKDFATVKDLREKMKANEAEIIALSEELQLLKIEAYIIRGNVKNTLAAYGAEVIAAVFQKYDGKQYGEKTRAAIYDDVKKAGISFYFEYEKKEICIDYLTDAGFTWDYSNRGSISNYDLPFVDDQNRVNAAAFTGGRFRIAGAFVENTRKQARDIVKAYGKYKAVIEKAAAAQSAFNSLLPETMKHYNNVDAYVRPL